MMSPCRDSELVPESSDDTTDKEIKTNEDPCQEKEIAPNATQINEVENNKETCQENEIALTNAAKTEINDDENIVNLCSNEDIIMENDDISNQNIEEMELCDDKENISENADNTSNEQRNIHKDTSDDKVTQQDCLIQENENVTSPCDDNLNADDELTEEPAREVIDSSKILDIQPCYVLLDRTFPTHFGKKQQPENFDNISNKLTEHMKSVQVLVQRVKHFACRYCSRAFLRADALRKHDATHIAAEGGVGDRFVKRFKCEICDMKFVLISTLEQHAEVHRPLPHACHCGVGFYQPDDLRAHKRLVHAKEIEAAIATLNFRQQRALRNEMWIPQTKYDPTKKKIKYEEEVKDEEEIGEETESEDVELSDDDYRRKPRPRLRAKLVLKKTHQKKRKPKSESGTFDCEKDDDGKFICPVCSRKFQAKSNVKIHLVTHTGEKPYPCDICGNRFTQRGALNLHLKRHTGIKNFECATCGKRFFDKPSLQLHQKIHTGEKPYICSHCGKAFGDPSARIRHERIHTGYKPYACKYCPKKFGDAGECSRHILRHEKRRDFQCKECQKSFYTKPDLTRHMLCIHSNVKKYICNICSKRFSLKCYLYSHMNIHQKSFKYECDDCGQRFNSKNYLKIHIFCKHLYGDYKCKKCKQKFSNKIVFLRHRAEVHRQGKYQCDDCGEKFPFRNDIANHIKKLHNPKCLNCTKMFPSDRSFQAHKLQGCIRCDCGKNFPTKSLMKEHARLHFERKNKCWSCKAKFNSKQELDRHFKENHSDKIKYECDDCGAIFVIRKMLLRHIFRMHSIMLMCHRCKKQFRTNTEFELHKSKACKAIKKVKCDICDKYLLPTSMKHHLEWHAGSRE